MGKRICSNVFEIYLHLNSFVSVQEEFTTYRGRNLHSTSLHVYMNLKK